MTMERTVKITECYSSTLTENQGFENEREREKITSGERHVATLVRPPKKKV